MVPPARRASAIGIVVWGATVGSVIGPTLVPISSRLAEQVGLPTLAGPYLVPVLFVGLAAILSFVLLRPDPYELADEASKPAPTGRRDPRSGPSARSCGARRWPRRSSRSSSASS